MEVHAWSILWNFVGRSVVGGGRPELVFINAGAIVYINRILIDGGSCISSKKLSTGNRRITVVNRDAVRLICVANACAVVEDTLISRNGDSQRHR